MALVSNGLQVSFWLAFKSQNLPKSVKTQQTLTSVCCEMTVNSQCKAAPSMCSVLFSLGVLCSAISSEGWKRGFRKSRGQEPLKSSVTNNRRHSQEDDAAPKLNIEPKKQRYPAGTTSYKSNFWVACWIHGTSKRKGHSFEWLNFVESPQQYQLVPREWGSKSHHFIGLWKIHINTLYRIHIPYYGKLT